MKLKSILFCASAILLAGNSFGQYSVTTGTTKYVLVEEATGPGCGYCPEGAQEVEQTIKPMAHAVVVSWHGTSYDITPMVVSGDPFCAGTGFIAGFPMATIDRATFGGSVGQSRPWSSYTNTQLANVPKFQVTMKSTYNPATKLLTVKVTGQALTALTGNWNISALVVEDSVASDVTPDYNQHSYLTSSPANNPNGQPSWWLGLGSPIMPATKYAHMQVVRAMLSASIWGDAAFTNPASGTTVTKTYTYTIPTTSVSNYMKVIGFVAKNGATTTDRAVENVIQSKVRFMPATTLGVAAVNTMSDIELFPNPAQNTITVKGTLGDPTDTKIVIYNSIGQVVASKDFKAGGSLFEESVSLNNLSNGIYFMRIINNGEKINRQFTINK
jgi:hypothetical protein